MDDSPNRDDDLVDRVIEGGATDSDWLELELRARQEPRLWDRLGRALRTETEVRSALESEVAVADEIELPLPVAGPSPQTQRVGLGAISGWAAAFLFAGLFFASAFGDSDSDPRGDLATSSNTMERTEPVAQLTFAELDERPLAESWEQLFDDAFAAYVATGRSGDRIQELDPIVVDARAVDGDEVEVWMIRRALEKRRIDEAWSPTVDEFGRQQMVPIPAVQLAAGETL